MATKMWFDFHGEYWFSLIASSDEEAIRFAEIWENRGWKLKKTLDIDMSNMPRFRNAAMARRYHPGF